MSTTRPGTGALAARLEVEHRAAEAQVAALTRDLAQIVEGAELVATDDEHDPEGHTIAWERQQLVALLDAAETRRTDLEAALVRVADGTYGTCATCGGPVGDERQTALPGTATCVTCAP